jgi:hypothetical protein
MKTTKRFLLAAILLAMAFTFSCSAIDDKSPSGNDSSSDSQGNQVPSSDSGGDEVLHLCQLSSACIQATIPNCLQAGGSIVATCQGNQVPSSDSQGNQVLSSDSQGKSSSSTQPSSNSQGSQVPSSNSQGKSSSSTQPSSNSQGSNTRCKDTQNRELYCNWSTGCYAIDPAYAETPGQSCATLVEECRLYGSLFAGTTAEGSGIACGLTQPSSNSQGKSSSSVSVSTQLYCDFGPPHSDGGGCNAISNASQCNKLDGGAVTTQCGRTDRLFCDYGPKNSDGGGCFMIASQANCDLQYGSVVTQCSAASVGTALYNSYPRLPSSPPVPPAGSGQLYCDFGPVHSEGGGCTPISNASQCNWRDGGLVANSCGRTDRLLCDFGPKNSDGGGCFMIASPANCNTGDGGRVVLECSPASL